MDEYQGRPVVISALVGSHNYNLNTPESDKDYKYFVLPTFDDLYDNKEETKAVVTQELDYTVHDLRKLNHVLWKSNINFIEILFSKDMKISPSLIDIYTARETIARMNLPYLYDACVGMHHQKRARLDKFSEGNQHLQKFGYNTKEAMHSYRVVDFLVRYAKNGFRSFQDAIWYRDDEHVREVLFGIKAGMVDKENILIRLNTILGHAEKFKEAYKSSPEDLQTKEWLYTLLKKHIREHLK